ncbi:ABC transporter substrate-binding protein [Eubacteriales bacterium OttesenSCG-928-K08]|nr:ABC transporter substrate-binding protein [Eubacteriales bacterium OttesenSCG-928-K08]
MKKLLALILVSALLLTVVTGCAGEKAGGGATAEVKDTLSIAQQADVTTLDPHKSVALYDFNIFRMIYNSLLEEDGENLKGVLAKSWNMADDALSATIEVNTDALFSNGEALKASDVAFSFNRALSMPAGQVVPGIANAEVLDETHVKVNFVSENPGFFSSLVGFFIVQEAAVVNAGENYGILDSGTEVGTGPYTLKSRSTGSNIVFEARDDYFEGKPAIQTVTYQIIGDANTAYLALQNGQIDFCTLTLPATNVAQAEQNDALAVTHFDSRGLAFITMNCNKAPFDNQKVRQAVAYALDKQNIIDLAEDGMGTVAQSPWNGLTFGYSSDVQGVSQDVEKAKSLLTEAGYTDGFTVTFKTMEGSWKKVAEAVQAQLAPIGIDIKIEVMDSTTAVSTLLQGNYDIANCSMGLGGDASGWETAFQTKDPNAPSVGALNMFFYSNSDVDRLFKEANTTDTTVRLAKYKEIATTLNEEAPIIPLYFQKLHYVHAKNLTISKIDGTAQFYVDDFHW